jgi:hypothetical protein
MWRIGLAWRLLSEAVGGRLFILPTAASGILAFWGDLGMPEVGSVPLVWIIPAAPLAIWIFFGLLNKAVSLQRTADLDPLPDMPGREAFQHVMLHSKWALGRNPDHGNPYEDVDREIGRAARLGRLKIWGELKPSMKGGFAVRPKEFSPEEWEHLHFDYPSCVSHSPEGAIVTDYSGRDWVYYENVEMSREQVFNLWPKANWFERRRDETWQDRLDYFKEEQKHYVTR